MENLGKIVRAHGSVLRPDDVDQELSFDRKRLAALNGKLAIAQAAVAFARPGDTIFVDAGTTTLEAGKRLLALPQITLFTNSIPLLAERPTAGARLIAVGGEVRSLSLALTGAGALAWVRQIRIDLALLGTSGLEISHGPTTTELSEAGVKSAVAAKATRVAVLADASKWGRPAAIRYAEWDQIHDLVIDHSPTPAERAELGRHGTRLHRVVR